MKRTLRVKGLIALAILMCVSAVGSYLVLEELHTLRRKDRDEILQNVAIQALAYRSLDALDHGIASVAKAFAVSGAEDIEKVEKKLSILQGDITDLDLFMEALHFGTESSEFRESKGGLTAEQWGRHGWKGKIVLHRPSDHLRQFISGIRQRFDDFARHSQRALKKLRNAFYLELQGDLQGAHESREAAALMLEELQSVEEDLTGAIEELIAQTESNTAIGIRLTSDREGRLHQGIALSLLLIAGIVIVVFWTGWNRSVLRPIDSILAKLREIGRGSLYVSFAMERGDEIGMLSNALGAMLSDLRERTVSRDFVDNILQSMADTIVVVMTDTTIMKVNHATLKLLHYESHDLIGQPMSLIVGNAENKHYLSPAHERELSIQGYVSDIETTYRTKEGVLIPVLFSASLMRNSSGEVDGVVCVAQDIRERKRSHNAITELRAAFEAAGIGAARLNRDGTYIEVDPVYAKMLGYTEAEMLGTSWRKTVHPADISMAESAFAEMLQLGKAGFESRALRKNGSEFHKRVVMVPALDEHGISDGHYCFMLDNTKEKEAFYELERAKDAALNAARVKAEFLANMSHEIRTPMNGVLGMTDLLLDTYLAADQRELAAMIKTAADSLLIVIDDILDFSKLESGKMKLSKSEVSGYEWFDRILQMMHIHAQKKHQELVGVFRPEIPECLIGDFGRVQQILINLLGNAIKFTPDGGGILIMAELDHVVGCEVTIRFSVSDSGVGIHPEKLSTIFAPFEQADTSTTRKFGGTGLGLAISRELVTLMGGRIWVESSLGVGSTFRVTLPFEVGAHAGDGDRRLVEVERRLEALASLNVFLLDTNVTNARILEQLLRDWGMIPTIMTDWEQGLAHLRATRQRYNLVILNVGKMDDEWRAATEREFAESSDTCPFLFLLPRQGEVVVTQLGVGENVQFLAKPTTYSTLLDSVVMAITRRGCGEAVMRESTDSENRIDQPKSYTASETRILVAEDNPVNQKLATILLEKAGYQVTLVNNGLEALQAVERENFQLVLMDIQMPEMGGDEAMKAIRQSGKSYASIPIIVLTAHAMAGDREIYLSMGANDYVPKPINRENLFKAIDRLLSATPKRTL